PGSSSHLQQSTSSFGLLRLQCLVHGQKSAVNPFEKRSIVLRNCSRVSNAKLPRRRITGCEAQNSWRALTQARAPFESTSAACRQGQEAEPANPRVIPRHRVQEMLMVRLRPSEMSISNIIFQRAQQETSGESNFGSSNFELEREHPKLLPFEIHRRSPPSLRAEPRGRTRPDHDSPVAASPVAKYFSSSGLTTLS